MKIKKNMLILFILMVNSIAGHSTNYYLHSSLGSDKNSGSRMDAPWKSINKVNEHEFEPGDSIFFARDGVWYGPLTPQGSGKLNSPIVISSYGEGALPLIIGNKLQGQGTLSLYNQSFWEISNLEITNDDKEFRDRRGVEVIGENSGIIKHIHLKNLLIHHIKGVPGNDTKAKRTAGIFIGVIDDQEEFTRFDDILIEGCTIHDVVNEGIVLNHEKFEFSGYPGEGSWDDRKFTNVRIRNNVIYKISKNAMIIRMTEGGIVEHNLCFETATMGTGNTIFSRNVKGTIFQYNEGFLNKSHDHDGSFYDPDLNSPETIWQYSYSHDNAHGLVWICTKEKDSGIIVRDNLSENDHGFLVYFNYAFTDVSINRNIFYVSENTSPFLIRENPKNKHHFMSVTNNLIFNNSKNLTFEYRPEDISISKRENRRFVNNHFLNRSLVGDYISSTGSLPKYTKFHRGYHHQPDELDSLFNNPILLNSIDSVPNHKVVAYVNGLSVNSEELLQEANSLISLLIAKNKRFDEEEIKLHALKNLIYQKVQFEYIKKYQVYEYRVLEDLDKFLRLENKFRDENTNKENVIFFGPKQFTLSNYYTFVMANAIESLKKAMSIHWNVTMEELQVHFLSGDQNRVDPAWQKRGLNYSIRAIRASLIDQKYDDYFKNMATNADVIINEHEFHELKINRLIHIDNIN